VLGLDKEWDASLPSQDTPVTTHFSKSNTGDEMAQREQQSAIPMGSYIRPSMGTYGGVLEETQSQVSYINGAPTLRDRHRRMSIDQMMFMCTRLGIVPDFATRLEVITVFKRAQHTGFSHGTGSSLHGYLSYEEFVDAIGQLAIGAYSKQPFAEEHPEAHEKVEAFLLRMLPTDQRDLLEKFLYGRGVP